MRVLVLETGTRICAEEIAECIEDNERDCYHENDHGLILMEYGDPAEWQDCQLPSTFCQA